MRRLLPALLCLSLLAADWPRFRGPNGGGISADKDVPAEWAGKNFLWKSPLPGVGHGSPIVVKGKVYLQAATDDARILACYDAGSGKELWAKKVSGTVGKIQNPKGSLASSTPCSDGERVYCVFWDGKNVGLHAYTLDGEPAWDRDLGKFTSQHGPGLSPVVHGGLVVVNNDQDGSAKLEAFRAKDGKPAWSAERKAFRSSYSTPMVLETKEGAELLVGSTAGLSRYALADGRPLWNFSWKFPRKPLRTVASPVTADGMAFLFSGDGDGSRAMVAVRLDGKDDVSQKNLAWDKAEGTPYVPTPIVLGGHVYAVTDDGQAVCYEAKSGKELWRAPRVLGQVSASPLLIDGKVFAVDEKGAVLVFTPKPEKFEQVAKNKLGEGAMATPAVADGRLFYRGEKHLICVGK